jgi:hypothetical protein
MKIRRPNEKLRHLFYWLPTLQTQPFTIKVFISYGVTLLQLQLSGDSGREAKALLSLVNFPLPFPIHTFLDILLRVPSVFLWTLLLTFCDSGLNSIGKGNQKLLEHQDVHTAQNIANRKCPIILEVP